MKKLILLLLISGSLLSNYNNYFNKEGFGEALKYSSSEIDINEKIKFYEYVIGYKSSKYGIFYIKYSDLNNELMMLVIKKYNELMKNK